MRKGQGRYVDMPTSEYFSDPALEPSLSQTIAKLLLERSPAHARLQHPRLALQIASDEPEKYEKVKAIGDAAHKLLIGRGKDIEICEFDAWRSGDAKKARGEALALGKTPILGHHFVDADAMVSAARLQLQANPDHRDAFTNGDGEVVLIAQEGDIWLRTMIDWLVDPRHVYDLKTSGMSCAPHAVVDRPVEQGWHIQAAMYERCLDVLDPEGAGRRHYNFVALENEPPYGLTVVEISEGDLTLGRKDLAIAVDIWRECMRSGVWPCYPPDTIMSSARPWREGKTLEREITHHERRRRKPIPSDLLAAG